MTSHTLFDLVARPSAMADPVAPWEPGPVARDRWPPDYRGALVWRMQMLQRLRNDPELLRASKVYYSTRPAEFIIDWCDTYDPRRNSSKWIPFVFFEKQAEFIEFLESLRNEQQSGLIEKCRDVGATWGCCAYSVWAWLFVPEIAIGWGSRKETLVDKLGDPDSIFEKMRLLINRMPDVFLPVGFAPKDHSTFMKLINPQNGATITGEAGDNIGRGGRKTMVFKDESAHYERPEKIEAALGDNTNTQIDISSVNGVGNVFHRRREAGEIWQPGRAINPGVTRVFIFDWRDHPEKTEEWYKNRRAKYEREGMLHLFAQEVDRSYSASVQNTIIPAEWIDSIVDAHLKIKWRDVFGNVQTGIPDSVLGDNWAAGLDVADEGLDKNAFTLRQSIIWRHSDVWGKRDTGETTRRVAGHLKAQGKRLAVQYDCIGVGAGVKSEYNRLVSEKLLDPEKIQFIPWNAGAGVLNPYFHLIEDDEESPLNGDFFENLKAQAWWSFRTRCYKTHKNITEGEIYPIEEMVSIDSKMPFLQQIKKELAQPVMKKSARLKTMIDKKPEGVASPNIADAGIMMYFPLDPSQGAAMSGNYGV